MALFGRFGEAAEHLREEGAGGIGLAMNDLKHGKRKNNKLKLAAWGALVLVVAGILFTGGGWISNQISSNAAIDSSKYQAVFFTNGQVYFGKLSMYNLSYMKLTDVYYLQSKQSQAPADPKNPQATSNQPDVELIKLGNEIHGPSDAMIISKDQVLFFENLKSDGKVSDTINKYRASH